MAVCEHLSRYWPAVISVCPQVLAHLWPYRDFGRLGRAQLPRDHLLRRHSQALPAQAQPAPRLAGADAFWHDRGLVESGRHRRRAAPADSRGTHRLQVGARCRPARDPYPSGPSLRAQRRARRPIQSRRRRRAHLNQLGGARHRHRHLRGPRGGWRPSRLPRLSP